MGSNAWRSPCAAASNSMVQVEFTFDGVQSDAGVVFFHAGHSQKIVFLRFEEVGNGFLGIIAFGPPGFSGQFLQSRFDIRGQTDSKHRIAPPVFVFPTNALGNARALCSSPYLGNLGLPAIVIEKGP